MKKNENIITFILGGLVVIIGVVLITACVQLEKAGVKISELESAITTTTISTEATMATEDTTVSTTTVSTIPERPLIVADMQRRLDVLVELIKTRKDEVEEVAQLQRDGKNLTDDQFHLLDWYSSAIVEEYSLIYAIKNKEAATK